MLDAQCFQTNQRPNDIHNGIHPPQLVEMDVIKAASMNTCFCAAYFVEDGDRLLLDIRRQIAFLYDGDDITQVAFRNIIRDDDVDFRCGKCVLRDFLRLQVEITQVQGLQTFN